ncbi:MAG: MmcQ/YjbR family DNA-binding protein [Gordonia sp. (in: high G+C Gram-positive bacteria)]|uniref:MmcQ/YjbR family DNA-binding protein n=1 Tax=Gordonia sp. (in: high G+C Gram-positive bacteria) TaxID=84139 RepID=UPI0039E25F73
MPHPIMFDDDDPVLARLRTLALALPEAVEKVSHGRPNFRCGKVFAVYGGGPKGSKTRHDTALLFIPDPGEKAALEQDDRFWVPAYYGPAGWLATDLSPDSDWAEVAELLDASFRQIAPKRAVARLSTEFTD